jgi:hypothetical protein
MLRCRTQPYAKAKANGVSLRPRPLSLRDPTPTPLSTALESVALAVDHVHRSPIPHRPHPANGLDQGATGQGVGAKDQEPGSQHLGPGTRDQEAGSQLHRVKLWVPST